MMLTAFRKRPRTFIALSVVGAVLAALLVLLRPMLVVAFEGSGLDPRIPPALRVPPSIDPELREHTKLFDRKVYKVGDSVYCAVGWGIANIIWVVGSDGVIVVDTGESTQQAEQVLA